MTSNEGQGHPNLHQNVQHSGPYHTEFERNQSVTVWLQANAISSFSEITQVGFPPLKITWMRSNEDELHRINRSQQYTDFHPIQLTTL